MDITELDFSLLQDRREPAEVFDAMLTLRDAACPAHKARGLSDPLVAQYALVAGVVGAAQLRNDLESAQTALDRVRRVSQGRAILRDMGTDLEPPRAAVCDVTLQVVGTLPTDHPIPQHTVVRARRGSVPFVVTDDGARWSAGRDPVAVVPVMHGEPVDESPEWTSDESRNQTFESVAADLIQNSAQRTIKLWWAPADNPLAEVEWTWAESFAASGPFDTHYTTHRLANGRTRFAFGNGRNGAVPTFGARPRFFALRGGGPTGNVGEGEIDTLETPVFDAFGGQLTVQVSNAKAAEGGRSEQSLEEARHSAPQWWRAQDRAVSDGDFAALALKVPGVLAARAWRDKSSSAITVVRLAILSDGVSGVPSEALKGAVAEYVGERLQATDDLIVEAADIVRVDTNVLGRARVRGTRARVKQLLEKVLGAADDALLEEARKGGASALRELERYFFDLRARAALGLSLFGDPDGLDGHAFLGDFSAIVEGTPGLANADILQFTRVPAVVWDARRGDQEILNVAISATTVAEEITVRFLGSTRFRVDGSVSGLLGFGDLGVDFEDEDGRIAFGTSGAAAVHSDRARFSVSPVAGNVRVANAVYGAGTLLVEVE